MKVLYLDIFSGISGDMFLGALIDLGVDEKKLARELKKLPVTGYHLHVRRRSPGSIQGIKFDVHLEADHHHHHDHGHDHDHDHDHDHSHHAHDHGHGKRGRDGRKRTGKSDEHGPIRNFSDIKKLIQKSKLSPWVKKKSLAVFQRIADAEGKVHGLAPDRVHFHEVGAVDSIVDIVGSCIALEILGKPKVLAAPVVDGTGWVDCAHGRFPVPTAATLEILGARGVPITQCEETQELVTPTGAALLAELVKDFGAMTGLVAEKIGYGLGSRQLKTRPNVLRVVLGRPESLPGVRSNRRQSDRESAPLDWETDTVAVLESNLDDISAEVLGHFVELAFAAGVLDAFYTPIQMKKSRPGVLLTVLCSEPEVDRMAELILTETSAFGVRWHTARRRKLAREFIKVGTEAGEVTVKMGRLKGRIVQVAPEYESCKQVASQARLPIKDVYEAAVRACATYKARKR